MSCARKSGYTALYIIIIQDFDFLVVTQFSDYVMAAFKENIEHRISTPSQEYILKNLKTAPYNHKNFAIGSFQDFVPEMRIFSKFLPLSLKILATPAPEI